MSDDVERRLLELEEGFWRSSTDAAYYEEHVSDDALLVFPYGVGVMDKPMVLYTVGANDRGWETFEMSEVSVLRLGEGAAMLVYQVSAVEAGDGDAFEAIVSSGYAQRGERWLLAFHQQTLAERQ
jgi:hypothetical protein